MGCAAGKEERHAQPEGVPFGAGTKLVSVLSNSSTAATQRAPDEELDRECSFNFVPAGVLRAAPVTDGRLPEFRVLKSKGQLVTKTIAFEKAVRGGYRHEFLAVSHRWEYSATAGEPRHPDPTGVQFRELQKYLKRNPRIKWVWIDWSCMPQGVRTVEEHIDYVTMMSRVGMLYLGCSALLLVDGSYLSRFWTQCEAWWSMQKCTANGLSPARGSERRWTVVCIHLAQPKIEGVKLEEVWSTASPADAYVTLSSPDVGITNDSDKDVQLPRVLRLDEVVRSAFKGGSAQLQAQIDAYRAGEALYFAGASEVFANGDRLTHGQRGEVVGPSTSVALKGKGLAMRFPGNNEFVNCYLSTLSVNDPPPLPGGHWVGEKLFFTGSSQTFADGERLTHGQKGLVVGPATAETHRGNGLAVAFPGNKASVNCYLNSLSTDAPPPLPGGHALGAKLFCTGPSKTFASGNRLTHGQQGEIVGPATGNLKGKGLAMRFPGNIGTIDCKLNHLSASAPSTRA